MEENIIYILLLFIVIILIVFIEVKWEPRFERTIVGRKFIWYGKGSDRARVRIY